MKKNIFVTGVTRMRGGFACVSGLDDLGKFVRPEIHYPDRPGIKTDYLYVNNQVVIRPLAIVEMEFLRQIPKQSFHTEDWEIDGSVKPRLIALPNEKERLNILSRHTDQSLDRALGDQSRSIVIIAPKNTPTIEIKTWEDQLQCHFSFYDEAGDYHRHLRVTDANWLAVCKHLWHKDRFSTSTKLSHLIGGKQLFLRIGITREWKSQVWRQVSGVFSVPDWLNGKCFADFNYDFDDHV